MSGDMLDLVPRNQVTYLSSYLHYPDLTSFTDLWLLGQADQRYFSSINISSEKSIIQARQGIIEEENITKIFPDIYDDLAVYISGEGKIDSLLASKKCDREFRVSRLLLDIFSNIEKWEYCTFESALLHIHNRMGIGRSTIRNTQVGINKDANGNSIVFLNKDMCRQALENLFFFIKDNIHKDYAICATVAYVSLVHIHPFNDGNGRTARATFNIIMQGFGKNKHYIPIRYIALVSRGGFLIKLRRAMYFNEWKSIYRFFSSAMRISEQYQNSLNQPRAQIPHL